MFKNCFLHILGDYQKNIKNNACAQIVLASSALDASPSGLMYRIFAKPIPKTGRSIISSGWASRLPILTYIGR